MDNVMAGESQYWQMCGKALGKASFEVPELTVAIWEEELADALWGTIKHLLVGSEANKNTTWKMKSVLQFL